MPDEVPVSIKVGVTSGCFHREHSPQAYALIDQQLAALEPGEDAFAFEEHESGPEVLAYVSLAGGILGFAASVIALVTAIVQSRAAGIQKGDHPRDPLRLKIRRTRRNGEFEEEVVLELDWHDSVAQDQVEAALTVAAMKGT